MGKDFRVFHYIYILIFLLECFGFSLTMAEKEMTLYDLAKALDISILNYLPYIPLSLYAFSALVHDARAAYE